MSSKALPQDYKFGVLKIRKERIMKAFETTFDNVLYRFSLMMLIVILSFTLSVPFLALLAVPVFLSAILGVKFEKNLKKTSVAKISPLESKKTAA